MIVMNIGSKSINKVAIRPLNLLDSKDNCFRTKNNYMQYSLVKTIGKCVCGLKFNFLPSSLSLLTTYISHISHTTQVKNQRVGRVRYKAHSRFTQLRNS